MRRARIKALASVPIRKNPVQNTVDSVDISDLPDKEQRKQDASSAEPEYEQEAIKGIVEAKKQKEEGLSGTDIKQEVVKDAAKASEETIKKEQKEASFVEPEPVIAKKSDSQEPYSQVKPSSQEQCAQVKPGSQELCAQAKPDSRELCNQINDKPEKPMNLSVQKSIPPPPDVPLTGADISLSSPTKNRLCFMRPVPRLDTGGRVRKNSIQGSGASASESEDEHGKKTASVVPSRIRNDSICSVQSNKESTTADSQNISPRMKAMQKRRMQVSESARRLAEARREFLLKHENRTPDKSQMKMYDFIYYNPVTNPMKSNKNPQRIIAAPPIPEEEDEDDPSAMPVPQVKVGPDGQLIIDEQSLVIEQKDAKRVREIMSNDIIIEEGICNNGGFYKKHKRSKDWPKWETLKFYRVLNVVGTDFLLMRSLFPNRTRQEIKQKYKKEERVNRQLIEKALKYHQEFNTEMLEEQLEMLQKLENIQNTPKKTSEKMIKKMIKNDQNIGRTAKRRKHRLVAKSIGECEALSINDEEAEDATVSTSDEIDVEINSEANNAQHQQMRKGSKMRKLKRRLDDRADNSDDESVSCSDSDSSPEIYRVRPTRSGRQPKKAKKLQAPNVNMLNTPNVNAESDSGANESSVIDDETVIPSHVAVEVTEVVNTPTEDSESVETSCPENITNVIPNLNQMEPGSLVIVSKESAEEPGNTILQVYMVSPNVGNVKIEPIESAANPADSQDPPRLSTIVTNKPETAKPIDTVDNSEK